MQKWNENLWLLTPGEYIQLKDGIKLQSINGKNSIKGIDYIDQDTRFGHIAYGLTKDLVKEQNLDHDFLLMMLKS